ncbi:MAG: hypothetical protein ACUVT3_10100 [Ignavibacterium sp.]
MSLTNDESNYSDLFVKIIIEHKFWFKIINIIELEIEKIIFYVGYTKEFDTFIVYLPDLLPKYYTFNISLMYWKDNEEPFEKYDLKRCLLKFFKRLNLYYKSLVAKQIKKPV